MIPFDEPNEHFLTFKIMPRHVNAHAYVNAGFRLVSTSKGSTVVGNKVLIMYGGIGPYTVRLENVCCFLFVHLSVCLSVCPAVCLSACLSVCLSLCLTD